MRALVDRSMEAHDQGRPWVLGGLGFRSLGFRKLHRSFGV